MANADMHPRQRMINLMYLVFIAMLAIQIDQEIIRSYNDSKDSLEDTRLLTQQKNTLFEDALAAKAENSPESFGPAAEKYMQIKEVIDDLVATVNESKTAISNKAGLEPPKEGEDVDFNVLNNNEAATRLFFKGGSEHKPSEAAQKLMDKMKAVQEVIHSVFPKNQENQPILDRVDQSMATAFTTKNKKKNGKNWITYKFYNQPVVAALSNLEIIATEARNIQSDALANMLREKVDADIKFTAYDAVVVGPTVVLQGDNQEVQVMIGTYANNVPGFQITGVDRSSNGRGFKALNTSQIGEHKIAGQITYNDVNGKPHSIPFEHTYHVIAGAQEVKLQSGALVSATKMNVLYRGLENPISGSILGADNGAVTLSASGGASVKGGKGSWTVRPTGGANEVTLTISGRDPKGKAITEAFKFRVKNVPPPVVQIRNSSSLFIPASSIEHQRVSVAMPDFDFPVTFVVTSFKVKVPGKAAMTVQGDRLSSAAALFRDLRSGDMVAVFDVQAQATGLGSQNVKSGTAAVINVQ